MYINENTCVIKGKLLAAMSANDFFEFCQANQELNFERDEKGNIVLMAPIGSQSSIYNGDLFYQVKNWNVKHQLGKVFDSNGGFTLPDGSQRAADVAWISNTKWNALTETEKEKFAPICPEFIIELKSKSDNLSFLQAKMERWMINGALLGWLIDPYEEQAFIYQPEKPQTIIQSFQQKISGKAVLPGFWMDLTVLSK